MSNIAPSDKYVYADYAAFSPVDEDVLSAMLPYYDCAFGNPSSLHEFGRRASRALRDARERIAAAIGATSGEIIFTGSGTEANNLCLQGIARANRERGNHVIVSSIEHPSILESARALEAEGFSVSLAPVDEHGVLDLEACMSLVTEKTILISVMYVNNEVGTVQPIEKLAEKLEALPHCPLLHTDACQAATAFSLVDIVKHVDLLTLNSTKVSGPAGAGMLYAKKGTCLRRLIHGGEQEGGMRAGTENLPAIVGFSLALAKAQSRWRQESERLGVLRRAFVEGVVQKIPGIRIHGNNETQSPAIVHVTVPFIEGEAMLLLLDHHKICASTGSACASMKISASHVLTAIGQDPDTVHGSLRFSFGKDSSLADVSRILEAFPVVAERLQSMTALTIQRS